MKPKEFKYSTYSTRKSEITDLITNDSGQQEIYISGETNGQIIVMKNPKKWVTIDLKEEDNMKILALKSSGKYVVALQQTDEKKFKLIIYDLEKTD